MITSNTTVLFHEFRQIHKKLKLTLPSLPPRLFLLITYSCIEISQNLNILIQVQYKLPRKTYLFVNGINVVITPYYARKTRIKCYNLSSSSKIVFIMNPKNPHEPDVTPVMIHSSKITPEVYPGITPFKISPRYIPVYYVLPKYHRGVFSVLHLSLPKEG